MVIYKILLAAAIILEIPLVPWFLKAAWPKKCYKSLALKMACASLFVTVGLLSVKITDNHSDYAKYIVIGLFLGWLGDLFLHVISDKIIYFIIGMFSFLAGHICYISAYVFAVKSVTGNGAFINIYEAVAAIIILAAAVTYSAVKKIKFGPIIVPGFLYAATLIFMLVKATALSITLFQNSAPFAAAACIILITGAFCFVTSDSLLAIIHFSGNKKNFKLKVVNIVTYFAAQVLIASSILIVGK